MTNLFFFAAVRPSLFGGDLAQSQVDGCTAILDAWDKSQPDADRRFVAYSLATTYHETARAMQPIREWGEGKGHAYGVPTGPWHQTYFGRGDAQLTFERNYAFATTRLRALGIIAASLDLERDADLALRPDIAAAVLIFGMTEGWFTSRKLADYFGASCDWVHARRIINALDCAEEIAGYGKLFLAALSPPQT